MSHLYFADILVKEVKDDLVFETMDNISELVSSYMYVSLTLFPP